MVDKTQFMLAWPFELTQWNALLKVITVIQEKWGVTVLCLSLVSILLRCILHCIQWWHLLNPYVQGILSRVSDGTECYERTITLYTLYTMHISRHHHLLLKHSHNMDCIWADSFNKDTFLYGFDSTATEMGRKSCLKDKYHLVWLQNRLEGNSSTQQGGEKTETAWTREMHPM